MSDQPSPDIPLPSGWARNVRTAVLHVISPARYAIVALRDWAVNGISARVRVTADSDRLKQEIQLFHQESLGRHLRPTAQPTDRPARRPGPPAGLYSAAGRESFSVASRCPCGPRSLRCPPGPP